MCVFSFSLFRELGDSSNIEQCYHGLGSLYLREGKPALALRSFREAVGVAREQQNWQMEVEILREMSQVSHSLTHSLTLLL